MWKINPDEKRLVKVKYFSRMLFPQSVYFGFSLIFVQGCYGNLATLAVNESVERAFSTAVNV